MSGWKLTLSLIPPPLPITTFSSALINRCNTSWGSSGHWFTAVLPSTQIVMNTWIPGRVLSVSGYTKKAWRTATRAHPRNDSSSTQPSEKVRKGSVTIPCVGQATEEIARLFRDRGVTTHIRPYNTIRATMVRPKDKLLMEEQCGVVYQITRSQAAYVGETERPLAKRLKEHQRPGSPVSNHLVEHNHSFTNEDVVVKHREN